MTETILLVDQESLDFLNYTLQHPELGFLLPSGITHYNTELQLDGMHTPLAERSIEAHSGILYPDYYISGIRVMTPENFAARVALDGFAWDYQLTTLPGHEHLLDDAMEASYQTITTLEDSVCLATFGDESIAPETGELTTDAADIRNARISQTDASSLWTTAPFEAVVRDVYTRSLTSTDALTYYGEDANPALLADRFLERLDAAQVQYRDELSNGRVRMDSNDFSYDDVTAPPVYSDSLAPCVMELKR